MVEEAKDEVVEEVAEEVVEEASPVTSEEIDDLTPEEVAKVASGEVPAKESTEPEEISEESPKEVEELSDEERKVRAARIAYYKEVDKNKLLKIEKEKALKEKEIEFLKLKAKTNQPLTEDEELELIEDDPQAYKEYIKNQASSDYETQIKEREAEIETLNVDAFNLALQSNVNSFVAKVTNVDVDKMFSEDGTLNPEMEKFMKSKQYSEVASYIDERFTKNGLLPTAEDMEAAYLLKFKDIVFAQVQATAAKQVNQKIKSANAKTSPLNGVRGGQELDPAHEFENATSADLDSWEPEKVAQYSKWLDERLGNKE